MGTDGHGPALVIAPEVPYPVMGGGALRAASLIEYLARSRAVDLIVFREPGAPDPRERVPRGLARRVSVMELPRNSRTMAAKAARNAARLARGVPPLVDRFAGFGDEIAAVVAERRYEIGVIEHFWCAPYVEQIGTVCSRTVLDLHNIESVLHARCAAVERGGTAVAHRVFRDAARRLERKWMPRFSEVLAASEADASAVRQIVPGTCVKVYPNAIPARPAPDRVEEDAIVFSGNMEYHPNVSAVRFFRREVWPALREKWPSLVWRLVGKNAGAVRQFATGDARIEVVGEVEDAVEELARAKVAVVPILAGSGTRLKILEAWAAGVPVVSTSLGAEGLPVRDGEQLLLADGGPEFVGTVTRLLACKELRERIGRAGRLLMEKEFTWNAAWKMLDF